MAKITKILLRRDTKFNWDNLEPSPILGAGEPAVALENNGIVEFKIGDGVKTWKQLPNILEGGTATITNILERLSHLEEEVDGDLVDPNDGLVGDVATLKTDVSDIKENLIELNGTVADNTQAISEKESLSNKVVSRGYDPETGALIPVLTNETTDTQYPSGKVVYEVTENLQDLINAEARSRDAKDVLLENDIEIINSKIPEQATAQNKLADKEFVNSTVASNTATFRGTFNIVTDLHLTTSASESDIVEALDTYFTNEGITIENNDYCFIAFPNTTYPTQFDKYDRYKFNGTNWGYEFTLNNSSFTAEQWAAINSGITSELANSISNKQDELIAGNGITLTPGTDENTGKVIISSAGETYSAGAGLQLSGTQFSLTGSIPYLTEEPVEDNLDGGLIFVRLDHEPTARYQGYWYLIDTSPEPEPVLEPTSAQYFTFDKTNRNVVTGYVGNETEIVIPRSYSLEETLVTLTGNRAYVKNPAEWGTRPVDPTRFDRLFNSMTFTDGTKTITYTSGDDFIAGFAAGGDFDYSQTWLVSLNVKSSASTSAANFLSDTADGNFLVYPITLYRDGTYYNLPAGSTYTAVAPALAIDETTYGAGTTISAYAPIDGDDYSVDTIGTIFSSISPVTSIGILENITNIAGWGESFSKIPSLTNIVVSEDNTTFDSRDNCNGVIETATNTLIAGCKNTTIPSTVTSIDNAFSFCTGLEEIVIPDNITSISQNAFYQCTGLRRLVWPSSMTTFTYCMYGATNLKYLTIPNTVTEIVSEAIDYHVTDLEITYLGTAEEWIAITKTYDPNITPGQWSQNSIPVGTKINPMWIAEPTCTTTGEVTYMDPEGIMHYNETTPTIQHTLDENHQCTMCYTEFDNLGSSGLTYALSAGSAYVSNYTPTSSTGIKIPECALVDNKYYVVNAIGKKNSWGGPFNGKTTITSIEIPYTITLICRNPFNGCSNLETITIHTVTPPELGSSNAFGGTPMTDDTLLGYYGTIYVPAQSVQAYKEATNWSEVADRIQAIPEN